MLPHTAGIFVWVKYIWVKMGFLVYIIIGFQG